jgi:hypothetical protein
MALCIPTPCLPQGWEHARPQSEAHQFLTSTLDESRVWSPTNPPPALCVLRTRSIFGGWDWDTKHRNHGIFFADGTAVLAHNRQGVVCPWPVQRTDDVAAGTFEGLSLLESMHALDTPGAIYTWTGFQGEATPALQEAARVAGDDLVLLALDQARVLGFSHLEGTWTLDGAAVGPKGAPLPPSLEVGLLWGTAGDTDALIRWLDALHRWIATAIDPTLPADLTCVAQNLTYSTDDGHARAHGMMGPQPLCHSGDSPVTTNAHQTLAARHRLTARFGPIPV